MRTELKAKFYKSKRGNFYFAITTDHLDAFTPTQDELKKCKDKGMNDFFQLFDDDDNKYYSGYANLDLMHEFDLDEFDILNIAMNYAGCTYIKTRNKAGKMEIL
jgi:hypothetical protein